MTIKPQKHKYLSTVFLFQAMLFRLPWKLWRYMEGGKMEEFGLEAKRHIIGPEEEETLAHQYATAFHSVLHRNNLYFAQVKDIWTKIHTNIN